MLALKPLLQQHGISQAQLARDIGLSPALVAQLLNHEKWPASIDKNALKGKITEALADREIAVDAAMFEPVAGSEPAILVTPNQEGMNMLLLKQRLSQAAKKHFGLFRDPFDDDINEVEDVFLTPNARMVREWLWGTAKSGGFGAVIGESGAGKTTLRLDLIDRINRERAPIIIIEPSARRMEDTDKKGKTLKSGDIEDAIIYTLAPLETPKRSPEAKSRQLERLLIDSRRSGSSHCLIIEEAHGLPVPTLKHLKRFHEIRDGFKKLLSVVLIGQPELKLKLAGNAGDVREVSQRCEEIELAPLDAQLEEYLRFKFKRVGADLDSVFEKDALDGIRARLIFAKSNKNSRESVSLMYPLMINNLVTSALNQAAQLGFTKVSGDLIKES
jgi:type II secretory pathway predicted ATPase ExeA